MKVKGEIGVSRLCFGDRYWAWIGRSVKGKEEAVYTAAIYKHERTAKRRATQMAKAVWGNDVEIEWE